MLCFSKFAFQKLTHFHVCVWPAPDAFDIVLCRFPALRTPFYSFVSTHLSSPLCCDICKALPKAPAGRASGNSMIVGAEEPRIVPA